MVNRADVPTCGRRRTIEGVDQNAVWKASQDAQRKDRELKEEIALHGGLLIEDEDYEDAQEKWWSQKDAAHQIEVTGDNHGNEQRKEVEVLQSACQTDSEVKPPMPGVCPYCHKMIGRGLAGHKRRCQHLDRFRTE